MELDYTDDLNQFIGMSVLTGRRVDYVQAGGGNTSVKLHDGYMAIKASGYYLKDMSSVSGFVAVDARQMNAFHHEEHDASIDCNALATQIAMSSIKQLAGEKPARPSVEVGFHSVLGKYVLHLHPVYANVLMCSKGGVEKALAIAERAKLCAVAVPYIMPGYDLTKLILDACEECRATRGRQPEVIFLKNHGVVTQGACAQEAMLLMDRTNEAIISSLRLPPMPTPRMSPCEGGYVSDCGWLCEALSDSGLVSAVRYAPIYPDQLVYTSGEMFIDGSRSGKISVIGGRMFYNTGKKEAAALDETMTALFYIYYHIKRLGFELELLSDEDCTKVLGWDSEKYRKSLLSEEK